MFVFLHGGARSFQEYLMSTRKQHELVEFRPCTFGDGGFYYHDGADRAVCSCGWVSAAVQRDKTALIALWKAHRETAAPSPVPQSTDGRDSGESIQSGRKKLRWN
jgi:hypothetical protein